MALLAEIIGSNIRRLRVASGMTQADLARKIGLGDNYQQISKYERGLHEPGDEKIVALCAVFECDPKDLSRDMEKDECPKFPSREHELLYEEMLRLSPNECLEEILRFRSKSQPALKSASGE